MTALGPTSTLYKAEFNTHPVMAKARPNLPMDSNTLAAMFSSVGPTYTCFHFELRMNSPVVHTPSDSYLYKMYRISKFIETENSLVVARI
jgi:hypothetical protein